MIAASSVFAQLLLLMLLLTVIGEPLRVIISRQCKLFTGLDALQAWTLNVYLAGLILYVIAIIPLHLFSPGVAWGLLIACGALSVLLHREGLKGIKRFLHRDPQGQAPGSQGRLREIGIYVLTHKATILRWAIVLAMFLIVLWIVVVPTQHFILGNSHDQSLHSLFVKVILENRQMPLTMQPYLPEAIIYPIGFHVTLGYASYILGYTAAKAVLYVPLLFNAMAVLGAYYLGRKLYPQGHLGVSFAFVLAVVATWPMCLIWGSIGLVGGLGLFLICLSFLPTLWRSGKRASIKDLAIAGILFGYAGVLYLTLYGALFISAILWLLFKLRRGTAYIRARLGEFVILFGFSLLLPAIFLYRFIRFYPYPGHNIGLPADYAAPLETTSIMWPLKWLSENITSTPFLRYMILALFIIGIVVLLVDIVSKRLKPVAEEESMRLVLITLGAGILQILYMVFYIPGMPGMPGHSPMIVALMPLYLLIAILNVRLYHICRRLFWGPSPAEFPHRRLKIMLSFVIPCLLFSGLYGPFIYYRASGATQGLTDNYTAFNSVREDDYRLMLWMEGNVEQDAVVLVNEYESGTYIPSVAQHKVIYPFTGSRYSRSYQELQGLIQQGRLEPRTYELMRHLNITHIYVGSASIYWWEKPTKWDAKIFLTNPNFRLVKNMGQAYLFEVLYVDPYVIFEDDFEYESLAEAGWQFAIPQEFQETGFGSATITSERAYHGERSIVIRGKEDKGWFYACWATRRAYISNPSHAVLSFYLDAASGFSPGDALLVLIADESWKKGITFSTPAGLGVGKPGVIELSSSRGYFKLALGRIWWDTYKEELPTRLFIQVQSLDVDGIENIGYVDFIGIEVGDDADG